MRLQMRGHQIRIASTCLGINLYCELIILLKMKYPTIVCCLFSLAIAGREQIQLEDIEKDNLANERNLKQGKEPGKVAGPASVQLQYGFVPMKNQPIYAPQQSQIQQQQYQIQYQYQPQYTPSNSQNYNIQYVQQQPQPTQYYPSKNQYTSTSQGYTTQYVQPQYQQQQSQYQTAQPQQNAYFASKYDNLQNLIDNHLQTYLTQTQTQHATTPQYVYVQPNQASTNNIHTIVDSKGNLQYYTYIPLSEIAGSNFVESDLTSAQTYVSNVPQTVPTKPTPTQNTIQYRYVQYEQPQYTQSQVKQNTQSKTKTTKFTNVQYYPQNEIQPQKADYSEKRQPQSLLDSYVPSILQYQYYKQQQAKLQQPSKASHVTAGKSVAVKEQQQHVPAQQEITSQNTYQHQQTNYEN